MGFHDKLLPTEFSKGSLFAPGADVKIITLQDSKAEHRILRSPEGGRRTYDLSLGIANLDALFTLYEFHIARDGALNSFRLKDWLDYATTPKGTTHRPGDPDVAFDDEDLVLIDAATNTYQAVRRYERAEATEVMRTIHLLTVGTIKVGDDTGELSTGFSFNLITGVVTFTATPTGTPSWGGEYETQVRFTEETSAALEVSIEALNTGALENIGCIEDVDPVAMPQDRPTGGAFNHTTMNDSNVTWSPLNALFQTFEPTAAGLKILLPDETTMPLGRLAVFRNNGTQALEIEDNEGVDVLNPFSTSTIIELWLVLDASDTRIWVTK